MISSEDIFVLTNQNNEKYEKQTEQSILPQAFTERMKQMLGPEYEKFLHSFQGETYRALRVNMRKTTVQEFLEKVTFALQRVPWTENGFYYGNSEAPGKNPLHEAGVYYIQEPSAMAPVPFLTIQEGDRVLDLCAAPGGKTTQIADFLKGTGLLVCNEIHPARAKILSENIERMGVRNAIVTNETPENLAVRFPGYFDKILVDAPCSGEGMFRKNEEASAEWSLLNVEICADRQDSILSCAQEMLRPGGKLVYSTCTFAPAEDEGSISRFLSKYPEFHIVAVDKPEGFMSGRVDWVENPAKDIEKTMRLMPHMVHGEGHFLAVLKKDGDENTLVKRNCAMGTEKSVAPKDYADFIDFAGQYLSGGNWSQGTFIKYGDQLYLGPTDMPALKGMKVLRPGLHLGTMKKNRFEPSHALALALSPSEVVNSLNYKLIDKEPVQFLGGMTLNISASDITGWCLVCVEGYSLGWGKVAGGIVKNHYPKGLRKV